MKNVAQIRRKLLFLFQGFVNRTFIFIISGRNYSFEDEVFARIEQLLRIRICCNQYCNPERRYEVRRNILSHYHYRWTNILSTYYLSYIYRSIFYYILFYLSKYIISIYLSIYLSIFNYLLYISSNQRVA